MDQTKTNQDKQQFIIHSLSKKSYITALPTQTLSTVRNLIHDEWDKHQYPPQFNFEVNGLLISTKQEVEWAVGDIVERGWRVGLVGVSEVEAATVPEAHGGMTATHPKITTDPFHENSVCQDIFPKSLARHVGAGIHNLDNSPQSNSKQAKDIFPKKSRRKANPCSHKMCKVEGCTNLRQGKASLGVCKMHGAIKMICKADGCDRSVKARGLCHRHWMQMQSLMEKGELEIK